MYFKDVHLSIQCVEDGQSAEVSASNRNSSMCIGGNA